MNDEEFEAQKARILALAEKWTKPLGLGYWRIVWEYERDKGMFEVDGEKAPETAACTYVQWKYSQATIQWNMALLPKQDDEHLEYIVVHELMHILTNEMRAYHSDAENKDLMNAVEREHEEHACTALAKAFIWVRDLTLEGKT